MMITPSPLQFGHVFIKDPDKKISINPILKAAQEAAAQDGHEQILGTKILENGNKGTYEGHLFETAKPEYDDYLIKAAQKAGAKAEIIQDDKLQTLMAAKMPWKSVLAHPFKVLMTPLPEKGAFISPGVVKFLMIVGWPKMIWAKIKGEI